MSTHRAFGIAAPAPIITGVSAADIWSAWNELDELEARPVHTIAARLGLPTATVAAVVYPAATFGAWNDDQEPS
jgi:hypothetical protein